MKDKEKIDNYYAEIKKTINVLSPDLNQYATSVNKVVDMKRPINDQMDITELKKAIQEYEEEIAECEEAIEELEEEPNNVHLRERQIEIIAYQEDIEEYKIKIKQLNKDK